MINVAIVEDRESDARVISDHISAWCARHGGADIYCTVYPDAVRFLETGRGTADIVFMDVEMPCLNGMDAAAELRKYDQKAVLIFTTRVTKYAVRGYSVDAIGYLLKPVGEDAFRETFEKALRLCAESGRSHFVMLKTKDGVVRVETDRIRYIEAGSHMLQIHTDSAVHRVWSGIDKIQELLPEHFVRCHRGYIVNLKYVDCVKKEGLQLLREPNLLIPISRQKRTEFMQALTKYYAASMRG